jgi:hypothetical protein
MTDYPLYSVFVRRPEPRSDEHDYEASRHRTVERATQRARIMADRTGRMVSVSVYWYSGAGRNMVMVDGGVEDIALCEPQTKEQG